MIVRVPLFALRDKVAWTLIATYGRCPKGIGFPKDLTCFKAGLTQLPYKRLEYRCNQW